MKRIGIVVSDFNQSVTEEMLEAAKEEIKRRKARLFKIVKVPGVFETPSGARILLRDCDAVVALGAVIKGKTEHDRVITYVAAQKLSDLSLASGKPVSLGIIGPGATPKQARSRAREYAQRAVNAAIEMLRLNDENSENPCKE